MTARAMTMRWDDGEGNDDDKGDVGEGWCQGRPARGGVEANASIFWAGGIFFD